MPTTSKNFSTGTMQSFRRGAARVARAARELNGQMGIGLRMIGEEIMKDVKDARKGHGVPVRHGTLRSTGRVDGPDDPKSEKPEVALSFGGPAAPYALIQHEVLRYRHKIGEARYLVRGLDRWRAGTSKAYAALKRGIDRGLDQDGKGA